MARNDPIVLDYHNSLLRQSDLDILDGPHWLNDKLVGFWFEYLENEVFPSDKIAFIGPEVTQLIKMEPAEEVSFVLESLALLVKDIVFLPVNDSVSTQQSGGSHWSLLVYERETSKFFHLDSSNGLNTLHATNVASTLAKVLQLQKPDFVQLKTTQQENSYDCGICVLCNCESAAGHYLSGNLLNTLPLVPTTSIMSKRREILAKIAELSES